MSGGKSPAPIAQSSAVFWNPHVTVARNRVATEALLRRLLNEVLGERHIDFTWHFVDLGGDSLAALRLTARLSEALGIDIPPILLFEVESLGDLAKRIDALSESPGEDRVGKHGVI